MFNACADLEEATFAPNTLSISMSLAQSSKLTSESVQSIINGLATVTTAQTLTLNKAIALTDEQKATIQTKGWTLVQ
jgi:plasmid maintenance system antidote protein VapI